MTFDELLEKLAYRVSASDLDLEQALSKLDTKITDYSISQQDMNSIYDEIFFSSHTVTNPQNPTLTLNLARLLYHLTERSEDVDINIKGNIVLSNILRRVGRLDEALELIREAASLATQNNFPDLEVIAMLHLGLTYNFIGRFREAIRVFDETSNHPGKLPIKQRSNLIGYKGQARFELGELEKAAKAFQQALYFDGDRNNWSDWAIWSRGSALILLKNGNTEESVSHIQQAIQHSEKAGDQIAICDHLTSLGLAYAASGSPLRAVSALEDAIQRSKNCGYLRGEAVTISKLARILDEMGEDAEVKYRQALTQIDKTGDLKEKGLILQNCSKLLEKRGQRQEAFDMRSNAERIFEEIDYSPSSVA